MSSSRKCRMRKKEQFKVLLAKKPVTTDPYAQLKSRPFVKKWTVDELITDVNTKLEGRGPRKRQKHVRFVAVL